MPANVTLFWCQDREWRYNPDREMKGDCTRSREARAKLGAKQCRHITINLPSQWCSEVHGPRTLLERESTYLLHTAFNHAWWRCKKDAFLQFWRKLVETNYYSLDLKLLTNFGVVVNIWSVWLRNVVRMVAEMNPMFLHRYTHRFNSHRRFRKIDHSNWAHPGPL